VRSLGNKILPKAQILEPFQEASVKLTPEDRTTQKPETTNTNTDLGSANPETLTEVRESLQSVDLEADPTTEPPSASVNSTSSTAEIKDETDQESITGTGNKNESSLTPTIIGVTDTELPPMTTISNRTIEISNRKVRVVIKRRVSRPIRRTSFPLVLPLPRQF